MENTNKTNDILIKEIGERIARFRLHVGFAVRGISANSKTLQNHAEILKSHAFTIFQSAWSTFQNATLSPVEKTEQLGVVLLAIRDLESYSGEIIPIPNSPPQLRRFMRFLERNVLRQGEPRLELNLVINKSTEGASTLKVDDVLKNLESLIIKPLPNALIHSDCTSTEEFKVHNHTVPITFSAFDSSNPKKWPITLHELGHHVYQSLGGEDSVDNNFRKTIGIDSTSDISEHFGLSDLTIDIESWIQEIWCDCFAAYLMGPIVFFAQFQTFLQFGYLEGSETHPSAGMRAYILETFLRHRHGDTFPYEVTKSYLDVLFTLENGMPLTLGKVSKLRFLCNHFTRFLLSYFPGNTSVNSTPVAKYNETILGVISSTSALDLKIVMQLSNQLKEGLPISSVRGKVCDIRCTTLEEIFYAGWICNQEQLLCLNNSSYDDSPELLLKQCENALSTTDERLLRSLQMSEWVQGFILNLNDRDIISNDLESTQTHSLAVMGHSELVNAIINKRLQVVPLIDAKHQIGRCSIDLRLGTSFELLSDSRGSIDFLNDESKLDKFITHYELDYGESITVSPGQFVLGHTMEFLSLPKDLCGQLDGRSSFARVGLLVHMTAGFIEPGYQGSVTLEIYNIGTAPIVLYPGYRICQLRVLPVGIIPASMFEAKRYEQQYGANLSRKSLDVEVGVISSIKKYMNIAN